MTGPATLRQLTDALGTASWFAALGEPLTPAETEEALACLRGLGRAGTPVAGIGAWQEAERLTRSDAWDRDWWQAEARMRQALLAQAAATLPEAELMAALTRILEEVLEATHGRAAIAAARAGLADPYLIRVAAGAAAQACDQAAVAAAAGAGPDHPFAAKLRLFLAGRWPLGIIGGTYYLF